MWQKEAKWEWMRKKMQSRVFRMIASASRLCPGNKFLRKAQLCTWRECRLPHSRSSVWCRLLTERSARVRRSSCVGHLRTRRERRGISRLENVSSSPLSPVLSNCYYILDSYVFMIVSYGQYEYARAGSHPLLSAVDRRKSLCLLPLELSSPDRHCCVVPLGYGRRLSPYSTLSAFNGLWEGEGRATAQLGEPGEERVNEAHFRVQALCKSGMHYPTLPFYDCYFCIVVHCAFETNSEC